MNSSPRDRLVDAGTRLLERDGPGALQARKIAAEVGASTMAVYTHFGGMTGLLEAIVAAAFERFGAALAAAPQTDDPMADFFVMGSAYRQFALDSPQRYRLMFGLTSAHVFRLPADDLPMQASAFGRLIIMVERMIGTGRIRADDAVELAQRIWSMIHGAVLLEIVGAFERDGRGLTRILGPMTVDLLVGMGDDRAAVEASLAGAVAVIERAGPGAPR